MRKEEHEKSHVAVLRLSLSAMLVALSVVLCRYLGYSPAESIVRVEIGFLPIALIGMLYGPLWSAVGYLLSDLIGAAITTGVSPLITLCKVAFGFLLGLFLHGRGKAVSFVEMCVRASVCLVFIGFFVDVLAMSWAFVTMSYSPSFGVAFGTRGINALVNYPIRLAVLLLSYWWLRPLIAKYQTKKVFHL